MSQCQDKRKSRLTSKKAKMVPLQNAGERKTKIKNERLKCHIGGGDKISASC